MKMGTMVVAAWSLLAAGACDYYGDDCRVTETCIRPDGGIGGGGGGLPEGCVPSDNPEVVSDDCGVFVSSSLGDDGAADGSKGKPFATIGEAVAKLGGAKAVYLCGESYKEAVALPAGVSLFGGLKCQNGWAYGEDARASIEAAADVVGLTIVGSGATALEDVNVTAPDAVAPGASSIAVVVDGAEVTAERCDFVAGDAAAGANGDTPMGRDLGGVNGVDGVWEAGMMCGMAMAGYLGGAGGEKTCAGDVVVAGGLGGSGTNSTTGGDGSTGGPMSMGGSGGTGDSGVGCQSGGQGDPGMPGTPGIGAAGFGAINVSGYIGVDGEAGQTPGQPGQGGGGGGGAKECTAMSMNAGPSGGGGGSGGCGGLAGPGGKAGGSSFALISLEGDVTLTDCKLTTGNGGNGGEGSDGQEGGNGGLSGQPGASGACPGGVGGKGGRGGAAGGGLGGHSLGIGYTGELPKQTNVLIEPGAAGSGGPGGDGGLPVNQGTAGANGVNAETRSFD